ncbi:MAG: glycosyltransferase family 2 protein [Clostridia bacterium]|nr:glycosyltransferase family 2 protein [Clostridia bacterium]
MRITVFTPTYNRGYIVENLYHSLQRQSFKDFEWIVVDDGSTDNTEELFKEWINENNFFKIIYIKVPNGGKHRAINRGVNMAHGELFFIVDSDDFLTDDALERIDYVDNTIPANEKIHFAGVCGNKGYSKDKAVGTVQETKEFLDITTLERPKYKITGDKAEVFYTEILKKYPFPEFEDEKFITECVVWDKIAYDGFKLRFFNEIIYICDYLPDGLTAHSNSLFDKSPKGWGLYIYQSGVFGKTFGVLKWKTYWDYYYHYKGKFKDCEIAKNLHINLLVLKLRIFGMKVFFKLYDR